MSGPVGRELRRSGHVLVVGLEGGGAAGEELRYWVVLLIDCAGPVVFYLVVVEGDDPGVSGVGGLEVGVGFVLAVAGAVVVEGVEGGKGVDAGAVLGAVLVDVVAEEEDGVDVGFGDVAVGDVVAVLVVLAGGEGEAEAVDLFRRRGGGAGASDGAGGVGVVEAVEELAVGGQAGDLDVDGVAEFGRGGGGAAAEDLVHGRVGGDLPTDAHRLGGHAAVAAGGVGGETVQRTKPSGMGSPEATPRVKGLALLVETVGGTREKLRVA